MDEPESFGAWVGRRRRALHLTQEAVAERLYCALGTLRKIESDERHPSLELAARLAQVLQLPEEQQTTFLKVARGELALDHLSLTLGAGKPRPSPGPPSPRTNLPRQRTSFVGRDTLLAEVRALLLREDVGLTTLTGPGGTGKTRLALQTVATLRDDFADGVCFVNLAPISDPALVASTIAHALGLTATSARAPLDDLKDYLRDKQILLLLDNFEQVADAAVEVAELLAAAPALTVLVTSRVPLHVQGEHERLVPPLTLPTNGDQPLIEHLSTSEAVRLFIERARAVKPDFEVTNANVPTIAAICARLDGFPLAIELAAARTKFLGPQALLARLDSRLHLLTSGARDLPARQQTLRNTIDWSYTLLHAAEQTLFRRLAVFVGGCDVEAVTAVCFGSGDPAPEAPSAPWSRSAEARPADAFEGLISLVDKSLLRQPAEGSGDVTGEPRFTMFETIREYALEQLEASGEAGMLRWQHAHFYLALAERAAAGLRGPAEREWLDRLESAHDNLRAALQWMLDQGETALGTRLAGALGLFWSWRGYVSEGRMWLRRALAGNDAAPADRARALHAMAFYLGLEDFAQRIPLLEESLRLYQAAGDTAGIASALHALGCYRLSTEPDKAAARTCAEESVRLFRTIDEPWGLAYALCDLGNVAYYAQCYDEAGRWYQEGIQVARRLGEKSVLATALLYLGAWAEWCQYDPEQAIALYEESLEINRRINNRLGIGSALMFLGDVTRRQGDYDRAEAYNTEALMLLREDGNRHGAALAQINLGQVAQARGNYERAAALSQEALRTICQIEWLNGYCFAFEILAGIAAAQGQAHRAVRLFGVAAARREQIGFPINPAERPDYDRDVAIAQAQLTPGKWEAGWAEGKAMTLEQAIVYALEESNPDSFAQ